MRAPLASLGAAACKGCDRSCQRLLDEAGILLERKGGGLRVCVCVYKQERAKTNRVLFFASAKPTQ